MEVRQYERERVFVFAGMGPKNGSNKRLCLVLAGPFHQHRAISSTLYLIRVNELRGKERVQYRDDQGIKGGKVFYCFFMNLIGGM